MDKSINSQLYHWTVIAYLIQMELEMRLQEVGAVFSTLHLLKSLYAFLQASSVNWCRESQYLSVSDVALMQQAL